MKNEQDYLEAFQKLSRCIPPIGFMSRKKRVFAYLVVTNNAQQMIYDQQFDNDEMLFILSLLLRKNRHFQKAGMTAALELPNLDKKAIKPIGILYANEIRKNLNQPPALTDETD